MKDQFDQKFRALTGNDPFPWQRALHQRLLAGDVPSTCELPTGLGKTSVIAVWLLARAHGAPLPRRLVYVVNRRTVVDQTTDEVERIHAHLPEAGISEPLAISTLRGQMADNREWSADPSQAAVICGTVDMIGSRLLFSGYRIGFRSRPLHAGFLGQDALLVHDEAHLEPAFQHLLETIQAEQRRSRDPWPMRVMALTATPRGGEKPFRLGPEDYAHPEVAKRLRATKKLLLHQHGDKDLVEKVVEQVSTFAATGRAVLVFLHTVDDVNSAVTRLRKGGIQVQQLTGTMRGLERERLLVEDEVFRRFLPGSAPAESTQTVALVCTSAGEVGVNLSADHLVCDLTTFDSMAQRFGRVNRFGSRSDSEVHVFHPDPASLDTDKAQESQRLKTLQLLEALKGDASPAALTSLDPELRRDAYSPGPEIREATDILFDAWALTTIPDPLPGRPPVEPYLHGVTPWEPPETQVAWREEVAHIAEPLLAQDLLDDYPLKPHEWLTDRTSRVLETLASIAQRHPQTRIMPVWVVREREALEPTTLERLLDGDRRILEQRYANCTLLLSPRCCGPLNGILTVEGALPESTDGIDVADEWLGANGARMRQRAWDGPPPQGMRLIRTLALSPDEPLEEDGDSAEMLWSWYEVPKGADNEGSRSATRPVLLDVHSGDVERQALRIVSGLSLDPGIARAVVLAAKLHDLGKNRRVWQRSIGNTDKGRILAKSGSGMRPLDVTSYRHELGSVLDAERLKLLGELSEEHRELALHLIAAHHGRARPHFPAEELFDPELDGLDVGEVGLRVLGRFATLQRRFGRWGLAYLESLVRAADYAASADPSQFVEVTR